MSNEITVEKGIYGRRAVLHTAWAHSMAEYFSSNNVVELELNIAKGWRGHDLFLGSITELEIV
jgi:hypothetical protein